jgi:hypothetical protein
MKRREVEPEARPLYSLVYEHALLGPERFAERHGEPSAALLAMIEEHERWRSNLGNEHRHLGPADWRDDPDPAIHGAGGPGGRMP